MWRIINKIEGYIDIDFTTLMIKYLFVWFWGESNVACHMLIKLCIYRWDLQI
jgi:hypothetical protein